MDKPDVDTIKGLSPAIAIEQKVITRTPRSTVGSLTEIYDYLRLLFARVGHTISPISGQEVRKDDIEDVLTTIKKCKQGDRLYIVSPLHFKSKRSLREELSVLQQKGFSRVYIEGLAEEPLHTIDSLLEQSDKDLKKYLPTHLLTDRIIVKEFEEDDWHRMSDSIATAFYEGEGTCALLQMIKNGITSLTVLNEMDLFLKSRFLIYFLSTIHLVLVLPVRDFHRYWESMRSWCSPIKI